MKRLYGLLLILLISGCEQTSDNGSSVEDVNSTVGNELLPKPTVSTTVRLLELNDLHAHLIEHAEQLREGSSKKVGMRGGLARTKHLIDQLRNENTIIVNVGDTFHGGAEALFSNGNDIVTLVNELGIDVGVIGNWDYGYGPYTTVARFGNVDDARVVRPNFDYIAANATYVEPKTLTQRFKSKQKAQELALTMMQNVYQFKVGEPFLPPYKIIEKSGAKIGIIGLTSDIVEKMSPMLLPFVEFTQGEAAYKALIEQLSATLKAQGANLVVVASELGIHKDLQLANSIAAKSVDIFLSAHTHEATFEMLPSKSGAVVVESGSDAYLGQMDVTFNAGEVQSLNWTLHELNGKKDETMLAKVDAMREKYLNVDVNISTKFIMPELGALSGSPQQQSIAQALFEDKNPTIYLTQPISAVAGHTTHTLERKHVLQNGFNHYFAAAMQREYNTTLGLTPGFRYDSVVVATQEQEDFISEESVVIDGNVSIEDVYRFLPSTNFVATGQIRGKNLKTFIEGELVTVLSNDAFNHSGGWFVGFSGLHVSIDSGAPDFQRLRSIALLDGTTLQDEQAYSVVSSCVRPVEPDEMTASTTMCGVALFENVAQTPITTADFLIQSLSKGVFESLEDNSTTTDLAAQPLWPQTPFVQPLHGL